VKRLDERKLRLMKLLEHWVKHNDEHGARYRESAMEAEEMSLINVSMELQKAYLNTTEVSTNLRKALSLIKESGG
jgi:hypothetical protein